MAAPKKTGAGKNTPAKASKGSTELTTFEYDEFEGAGFENQTDADRMVPFLSLLQSLSPLVEENQAKAGQIYNTVTEELTDSVTIVPVSTEHVCTEWLPDRGGFVASHAMDSDVVVAAQRNAESFNDLKTPSGNDLVETFNIYAVLVDGENLLGTAVVPFTSTKIKVYRQYMERLRTVQVKRKDGTRATPPMFAHLIKITTVPQEHKKGKSFNFKLEAAVNNNLKQSLLQPSDIRFQAGAELYQSVKDGLAKADYEKMAPEGKVSEDDETPF